MKYKKSSDSTNSWDSAMAFSHSEIMFIQTKGPIKNVDKHLKILGFIFIGLGILHVVFPGIFSIWLGVVLILIGVSLFLYRAKFMIIILGVILILVGLVDFYKGITLGFSFLWILLSILENTMGIIELGRYPKKKIKKTSKTK